MQTDIDKGYKFYSFLGMLYLTALLAQMVVGYRMVSVGSLFFPGSALIIPLMYFFADITAEVYGYKLARKLIWMGLICDFIFVLLAAAIHHTPYKQSDAYFQSYSLILPMLLRSFLCDLCSITLSEFSNIYFVSRWKVMLKGRSFWLRMMGASAFGIFIYGLIGCLIAFSGIFTPLQIINAIFSCFFVSETIMFILIIPGVILAEILKEKENIDVYDNGINYNPFKIAV